MICETCGQNITNNNATTCPYCNAKMSEQKEAQDLVIDAEIVPYEPSAKNDNASDYVITPEVVGSENYNSGNNGKSGYAKFVYTSHRGHGVSPLFFENGCFSALITLVLALSCVIQFGLLAGIGFLVFSGIGSIFTFYLRIKNIMAQKAFNPWFVRVISWCIAYMLIIWLAG